MKTYRYTSSNHEDMVVALGQDALTPHRPVHPHWHMLCPDDLFNHSLCIQSTITPRRISKTDAVECEMLTQT